MVETMQALSQTPPHNNSSWLLSKVNVKLTVARSELTLLSMSPNAMNVQRDMCTFTSSANAIESQSY